MGPHENQIEAAPGLWLLQVRGCTAAGLLVSWLPASWLLDSWLLSTCELLDIPGNK